MQGHTDWKSYAYDFLAVADVPSLRDHHLWGSLSAAPARVCGASARARPRPQRTVASLHSESVHKTHRPVVTRTRCPQIINVGCRPEECMDARTVVVSHVVDAAKFVFRLRIGM